MFRVEVTCVKGRSYHMNAFYHQYLCPICPMKIFKGLSKNQDDKKRSYLRHGIHVQTEGKYLKTQ